MSHQAFGMMNETEFDILQGQLSRAWMAAFDVTIRLRFLFNAGLKPSHDLEA